MRLLIEIVTTVRYRIPRLLLPLFDRADYLPADITKRCRLEAEKNEF